MELNRDILNIISEYLTPDKYIQFRCSCGNIYI